LGIYFWQGAGKKLENSGFYFHLEPQKLMLGSGFYMFPKNRLHTYRSAIADPEHALNLEEILDSIKKSGDYTVGGKHYKRVPAGFEGNKFQLEFLCYNGLWASSESKIPGEIGSAGLIEFCLKRFKDMSPLHFWLMDIFKKGF
jgi:uncharacterized protein (DUF2461 family)